MTSASFCFFSPPAGKASASVAIFLLPFVPAVAAVFPVRVCRRGLSVRGDRRRIETGARQFAFGLREAIGGDDLAAAIRHAVPFGDDALRRALALPHIKAASQRHMRRREMPRTGAPERARRRIVADERGQPRAHRLGRQMRSEEHTSELQSLMRISYAVFCLKKQQNTKPTTHTIDTLTSTLLQHKVNISL